MSIYPGVIGWLLVLAVGLTYAGFDREATGLLLGIIALLINHLVVKVRTDLGRE